jgi:hypothetical protein
MQESEPVEQEILVRGERCKVVASRRKTTWDASGTFAGKVVSVHRANTAAQAFEWWKNKAGMQRRG